ncbi:hypothetical protein SRB5_27270 [Streptomyces sp. RB5]|uniref:CHAT domain-containing protein n=1 Tax=Streptomyces smaragdinus TaxID=2585196 RepID=A0A7K0CGJ4_9ACTN|nr:hypothetical protein [Streptomyces smaragdinus]
MQRYEELRIRARMLAPGRYLVAASGAAAAAGVVDLPAAPAEYRRRFERLVEKELGLAPAGGTQVAAGLRELGRELFDVLLEQPLPGVLDRAMDTAQQRQPAHGLRLRFDLPPELRELPLETLTAPAQQPQQSLAVNHNLSLIRTLNGDSPEPRLPDPAGRPTHIRLLVATASPRGCPPVLSAAEIAALEAQLPRVAVRMEVLHGATRSRLEELLTERGDEPTALLLAAHGVYDGARGEGFVLLETEDGGSDRVPGSVLGGMLVRAAGLRLVVLNLCSGAESTRLEPYSGLAQALVGRGLPAVVAMQSRITETASAVFSPALLRAVGRNCSLDEAMTTARRRISDLPGHTTHEWTVPAVFLHEKLRHGWLFRAREVRDEAEEGQDPLAEGLRAWRSYEHPFGHVTPAQMLGAARFLRDIRGDWEQVRRLARELPRGYADEAAALEEEAAVELAWPRVEELCRALVLGDRRAAETLVAGLPEGYARCLRVEAAEARELGELLDAARMAEDWRTVREGCARVLGRRPNGFLDAAGLMALAEEELELDEVYESALAAQEDGDWAAAREAYARIAGRRPEGYRDSVARACFTVGRIAEDAGDWTAAVAAYEDCPGYAGGRLHFARGRRAAADGDWAAAREAFARCVDLGKGWAGYAAGRLAEDAGDWAEAARAYSGGVLDGAHRLLYARGRAAGAEGDWPGAVRAFEELREAGGDPGGELAAARARVAELAAECEAGGDFERAAGLLAVLPDAADRSAYVRGRLAERAGDWATAVQAFQATARADAPDRLAYARARSCELGGLWEEAREYLAGLPPHLHDTADRMLWVSGRLADAQGDWAAVIEGFGRLADGYADGEVGRRRRFARARLAAGRGEWTAVTTLLEGVPDEAREGGVRLLRHRAAGMTAQAGGRWARAQAAYAEVADADPELRVLHDYARARTAELAEDWAGALALYDTLPDDHADVGTRAAYARARIAEEGADGTAGWRSVAEAYGPVPAQFSDTRLRAGYARARRAEAAADWTRARTEAAGLGGYRDAAGLAAYAGGRLAEDAGDWTAAVECYAGCGDRADAGERAARARGRLLEATGQWTAAAEAYEAAGDGERLLRVRRLREALPWADGLAEGRLVADRFAVGDGTHPYQALRAAGITPGSSTEDVQNAAYTLMEQGGMDWRQRVALDQLRQPAGRLLLDAQLYALREPRELAGTLAELAPADGDSLLATLCARLPADAPLLVLLARGRQEAIELWERRLRESPGDMRTAHALAVAWLWEAEEREHSGAWEHAVTAWRHTLAYWPAVLTDDTYWTRWRTGRADCFGHALTAEALSKLRWDLHQDLFDRLSAHAERHAAQGRAEQARGHEDLITALEEELEAARRLKEAGGLPLDDGTVLAAGPAYTGRQELARAVAARVADLDAAVRRGEEPGELTVQAVRCAFSSLSASLSYFSRHRFEQALRSLPAVDDLSALAEDCPPQPRTRDGHLADCGHCRRWLDTDPAYLLLPHRRARLVQDTADLSVRAHLALAGAALADADGGLERAFTGWTAAIAVAGQAKTAVRTKRAVLRMVLGHAETLAADETETRGDALGEAIALIERALPLLGGFGREPLTARLAELLSSRGIWYGFGCSAYGREREWVPAEKDLRRALELNPESPKARDNLVRALVFGLDSGTSAVDRLTVVLDALRLVHEGLERLPRHRRYHESLGEALTDVDTIVFGNLTLQELITGIQQVPPSGPPLPPAEQAVQLAEEAEQRFLAGDTTGALNRLVRATRADPYNSDVRRRLIGAVEQRLTELTGPNTPQEPTR